MIYIILQLCLFDLRDLRSIAWACERNHGRSLHQRVILTRKRRNQTIIYLDAAAFWLPKLSIFIHSFDSIMKSVGNSTVHSANPSHNHQPSNGFPQASSLDSALSNRYKTSCLSYIQQYWHGLRFRKTVSTIVSIHISIVNDPQLHFMYPYLISMTFSIGSDDYFGLEARCYSRGTRKESPRLGRN